MKPEEQSPCSRFGPNTEDLTNASKQVRTIDIDMLALLCDCVCLCFSTKANILFLFTF